MTTKQPSKLAVAYAAAKACPECRSAFEWRRNPVGVVAGTEYVDTVCIGLKLADNFGRPLGLSKFCEKHVSAVLEAMVAAVVGDE